MPGLYHFYTDCHVEFKTAGKKGTARQVFALSRDAVTASADCGYEVCLLGSSLPLSYTGLQFQVKTKCSRPVRRVWTAELARGRQINPHTSTFRAQFSTPRQLHRALRHHRRAGTTALYPFYSWLQQTSLAFLYFVKVIERLKIGWCSNAKSSSVKLNLLPARLASSNINLYGNSWTIPHSHAWMTPLKSQP